MIKQMFEKLADLKLYDQIYIAGSATHTGMRINSFTGYFKKWDEKYGFIHVHLSKTEPDRVIIVNQAAILWAKDAITGEIKYVKDQRALLFGAAI